MKDELFCLTKAYDGKSCYILTILVYIYEQIRAECFADDLDLEPARSKRWPAGAWVGRGELRAFFSRAAVRGGPHMND